MKIHSLPGVLHVVAPFFGNYGYLTIFIALAVVSIVVPGEAVLTAAALYASFGKLNIVYVVIVGIISAVIGSNIGYVIGNFGGHRLITKFGHYIFFNENRFNKAKNFFEVHGWKVIIAAPFIEGQTIAIVAGSSKMPWRTFFIFNIVGVVIWVATWAGLGYLFGTYITVVYETIKHYLFVVPILVLFSIALIIFKKRFNLRQSD